MLLIPTRIGPSSIHGIGLFSVVDIPKGTVIWRWDPSLDQEIPWDIAQKWPQTAQKFLQTYAYRNLDNKTWMLCGDAARHMNHSFTPNIHGNGPYAEGPAIQDIRAGEELTIDYRGFDPDFEKKLAKFH